MEIKTKNIFGVAIAVAIGTLTFVKVSENYDSIKDKFSNIAKKTFDGIKCNQLKQNTDNEENETE